MNLAELGCTPIRVSLEQYDALTADAPDKITDWVLDLNDWRLAHYEPPAVLRTEANPFAGSSKVGRNDPCPCGSGKKYKRCCGLNRRAGRASVTDSSHARALHLSRASTSFLIAFNEVRRGWPEQVRP
jgi:hypothetical protein